MCVVYRPVNLKLVFNDNLSRENRESAIRAAERLKGFEIHVEGCTRHDDAAKRIRQKGAIHIAAMSRDTLPSPDPSFHPASHYSNAMLDYAIAILPFPILKRFPDRSAYVPVIYSPLEAAVISLSSIRPDGRLSPRIPDVDEADAPRIVEMAVLHAAGHIFITGKKLPEGGCPSPECVMGRIEAISELILLRSGFCGSCSEAISGMVRSHQSYGCA